MFSKQLKVKTYASYLALKALKVFRKNCISLSTILMHNRVKIKKW